MVNRQYDQFDLEIEPCGDHFCAHVIESPAGQAYTEFTLPFSDLEIANFVQLLERSRGPALRGLSTEMGAARSFGGSLFEAVFSDEVGNRFRASTDQADGRGAGLRVRLRLVRTPQLAALPWEYLYDSVFKRFLAQSTETPVVRYLDLPERIRPLPIELPLAILVLIASPTGFRHLDGKLEYKNLRQKLRTLIKRGLVILDRVVEPTFEKLQEQLRQREYHIFHFIGHGYFDQRVQNGVLVFETESGSSQHVTAMRLGALFHGHHRSLRVAVLNACEGARGPRGDSFSGMAQGLVQQGIPAVIAMQFEITDKAAITFSKALYSALADGYPIDAALAEARIAILGVSEFEWGTPVLFMRAPDGHIFDVHTSANGEQRKPESETQQERRSPKATKPLAFNLLLYLGTAVLVLILAVWSALRVPSRHYEAPVLTGVDGETNPHGNVVVMTLEFRVTDLPPNPHLTVEVEQSQDFEKKVIERRELTDWRGGSVTFPLDENLSKNLSKGYVRLILTSDRGEIKSEDKEFTVRRKR